MPIDKYSGCSQEVARILRKFDEWAEKEVNRPTVSVGHMLGVEASKAELVKIASTVNREFEELQAVSR